MKNKATCQASNARHRRRQKRTKKAPRGALLAAGSPYRIRTGGLRLERAASWAARRTGLSAGAPLFGGTPPTGRRRPGLPPPGAAVLSALGCLTSGFGTGPGMPTPPWSPTGRRRSACRPGGPGPLRAAQRVGGEKLRIERLKGRARAISAARLRASPPLHLRSIDQVFYLGPYRKETSSRDPLPA